MAHNFQSYPPNWGVALAWGIGGYSPTHDAPRHWRHSIKTRDPDADCTEKPSSGARPKAVLEEAFRADPADWRDASPFYRLQAPPSVPWLAVCSSLCGDSCPQALAFAARAASLDGQVSVRPDVLSHADLNDLPGAPGAYTDEVDAFLRSLGLP